ncbi:Putative myosin light chain kinase 3 [Sparganum proliferum]
MQNSHTPTFFGLSITPIPRNGSPSALSTNFICLDFYSAFVQNLCFCISSVPDPLEIYGRFNSFQPYRFVWLKDGRLIKTTQNISVSLSAHSSLLRVDRPEEDSSGIYTCVVFHSLGRSQASICIVITPDPDEDEEVEEIEDVCSDVFDFPDSEGLLMDYRPIYRPSVVLGSSNTTQRMVWNTRNYSYTAAPVPANAGLYGYLSASTNTDSANRQLYKPRSLSETNTSSTTDLHSKLESVFNQNSEKDEGRMGKEMQTTAEQAKGRTDSSTWQPKSTYFSWLPRIFRRKKSAENNAYEQLLSRESRQVPPAENKLVSQNDKTNINGGSVPLKTTNKPTPVKMVSRMISNEGTSTCMKVHPENPQSAYSQSFIKNADNFEGTETVEERNDSRKNSHTFSIIGTGLKTATYQSTLRSLPTEVQPSIYQKRPQSLDISAGMGECAGSVETIVSTKEEAHEHEESQEVKLSPCKEFNPVNCNVERIKPVVVPAVNCAEVENGVEPITSVPLQVCSTDDDSPYSSDIDRPHRGKHITCKTPPCASKRFNGFLPFTAGEKGTPVSSPRPVKSSDDETDGGGTGLGLSTSCDRTVRISQELSESPSSMHSQTDSDLTSKRITAITLPDRARSFNTIQCCSHAEDGLESITKNNLKGSSFSATSEDLEWFSLGSKRTQMLKKSRYGTADSACFPHARSRCSVTSERGYTGGLSCTPPAVSVKRKRDLLWLDGEPHQRPSTKPTESQATPDLSEGDSLKVSSDLDEVDSGRPRGREATQHQLMNSKHPLEKRHIEPVEVNAVNAALPVASAVLKRPDFESAHLRTDQEGELTRPSRTRLEGVQLLVAKYEQSAGLNSSLESLSDSGVSKSISESQLSKRVGEVNHKNHESNVPGLLRADRDVNKAKHSDSNVHLSDNIDRNHGTETEQPFSLKSPPAVDLRRNRESTSSVNPLEENGVLFEQRENHAIADNKATFRETPNSSETVNSPSQVKVLDGKTKEEMMGAASVPVLSNPPESPRVSQPIRMALSQTRTGSIENDKRGISATFVPVVIGENGPRIIDRGSKPGNGPQVENLRLPTEVMSSEQPRKHFSEADIFHSKKLTRGSMVSTRPNLSHILHKEESKERFTPDPQTHRNVDPAKYFTILEQLGKGKFGRVNRCQKKDTEEVLAMKVVRIAKLRRAESGDLMEVAILRAIGFHESIASLYCAYEYRNECFIFSEYVSGGALYERIVAEDNLDEKICASIIRQLLLGLQHIQNCSVLHLDLKPENVMMVAPTGYRLKIIDFGLACFHNPSKPTRSVGGTFTYSAPETINYEFQDFSTDIWSVAVIAYEILSGITPFEIPQTGDPERELSMAEITTNIISCRYHFNDPGICDATEMAKNFIRSILKRNPNERPTVESCLKHEWMMTSEDLPTVRRTVSLRRRNTARERDRPVGSERCQSTVGVNDVWRT